MSEIKFVERNDILGYIDRLYHSGLGKQKSLEYLTEYIGHLTYLIVDEDELNKSELWMHRRE